jgi:hypothetical protein
MTRSFRRFEVLLPLRFNDGQPVPDGLIADTVLELFDQFGAVSSETQTIRGRWGYATEVFRDDLMRAFVDTDDSEASIEFFVNYKEQLKLRFEQIDFWIATNRIEII